MQKILLTKEEFCRIVKGIREQKNKTDKLNDALDAMSNGFFIFDSNNEYKNALILTLCKIFAQDETSEYNTIEWYLFESNNENNEHITYKYNRKLNINTDELCYELLVAEFEERINENEEPMKKLFETYGIICDEPKATQPIRMTANEVMDIVKQHYIKNLEDEKI